MAATLEQTRLLHQEIEKHEQLFVEDMLASSKTIKDQVMRKHRVNARLQAIMDCTEKLLELYEDKDGARKAEFAAMSGRDVFTVFYARLKQTREAHRRQPNTAPPDLSFDVHPQVEFSGEENFGKFVDLHALFLRYLNLGKKGFARCDYIAFLGRLQQFAGLPKKVKLFDKAVQKYMNDLLEYLMDFHARLHPLVDRKQVLQLVDEEFETEWKRKEEKKSAKKTEQSPKKRTSLYCTPCGKQFAKSSVFQHHLEGKRHRKAVRMQGTEGSAVKKKEEQRLRGLARLEARIAGFARLLKAEIEATRQHLEKKQTQTLEELQAEREAVSEEESSSSESSDEEQPIYNPHNVPLGYDGKPIPYWLYKLHGLNIEYKCEICGNYSYRGPRAFQRHFKEWRHSYGMRCLGIPNTQHFMNVTLIEDALTLFEKLKREESQFTYRAEDEEEFEDRDGNVFKKKTFDDLKRQGII